MGNTRALLAVSARFRAGVVTAGCAVVVVTLGVLFARQSTADGFDRAVDAPVITWFAGRHDLAGWLALPGTPIPAVALSAAIAVACLIAGRRNGAVLAVTAVPVAVGLNEALLKPLVHRTYLGQVVYPSGHTTTVFALAAVLTVLLLGSGTAVRVLIPVAYLVAVTVVVAVIGLRYHYFTDTAAGAALGTGTVCGLALLLDLPAVSRWLGPRPTGQREDHAGPQRRDLMGA